MKRFRLFLLPFLVLIIATSCNKNKQGEDLVIGNWKMTKTYSGWGGVQIVPPGETYLLKINSDHHFQELHNDTMKFEGEWKVYSRIIQLTDSKGWIFKDLTRNYEMVINRQGTKLEFYQDGVMDGGGVEYEHY